MNKADADMTWRKRGDDKRFRQPRREQPRQDQPLRNAFAQCTACNALYTIAPRSHYERTYRKFCLKSGRNLFVKAHECEVCSGRANRDLRLKQRGVLVTPKPTPKPEPVEDEYPALCAPKASSAGVWGKTPSVVKENGEIQELPKSTPKMTFNIPEPEPFEYCPQCCDCEVRASWADEEECYCQCVCEI